MRDFWDINNDGDLDIMEKSMRDATIMSMLDDDDDDRYVPSGSSSNGMNVVGMVLLVLGVLLLFGACAA